LFIDALSKVEKIAFRGEIVLPKEAFVALSSSLTSGGTEFANARNATAGTLRQLDTALVQKRRLTVCIYDILFSTELLDKNSSIFQIESAEQQFQYFRLR
jgi:DNA ligase (NAD+)